MSSILNILQNKTDFGKTDDKKEDVIITNSKPKITINPFITENIEKKPISPTVSTEQFSKIKITEVNKPVNNNTTNKTRVMLCGTYPIGQSNGYSRVLYYISKYLGLKDDLQLTIYGFQNFKQTTTNRNDIPSSVILHDALATENPKRNGFGEKEIVDYMRENPQDIVIIFNDMVITSSITKTIVENMTPDERKSFKLISYMDQVYPYQKPEYINLLNTYFDGVIAFTSHWKNVVRELGLKKDIPCYFFPHGFDSKLYFPINKNLCRLYFNIPQDAFVILNLNRNQPRKRLDHTIIAYVNVVERHIKLEDENKKPLKLMIATTIKGFWNLIDIYKNELRRRNIPEDIGMKYLSTIPKPQQLSDRDINILYNACDIGLNTCEGEGFGLCQFEHLAIGCPQVAANIGGFKEFLNNNNSILVEPKWNYYIDNVRDGIGGMAEVSDPNDFADAIWKYYTNPDLIEKHGKTGKKEITENYDWGIMVNILHQIIHKIKKL